MKRWAWLCLLLFALPAWAQDSLGRLFFTPEQRAMLDLARRTQQASGAETGGDEYQGVTLNGLVVRSDGKSTVWINGRPQQSGQPAGYGIAKGRAPASANIQLPGGHESVRLKVGQTLDPASGRIEEGYRRPPRAALAPEKPSGPPVSPAPSAPATKSSDKVPQAPADEDGGAEGVPDPGPPSQP
jgi:hypothetical protein